LTLEESIVTVIVTPLRDRVTTLTVAVDVDPVCDAEMTADPAERLMSVPSASTATTEGSLDAQLLAEACDSLVQTAPATTVSPTASVVGDSVTSVGCTTELMP
jgi:hypothetical protein